MESNNQCNQASDQYNPLDDTINTVLPGLLPALIVGLFKGFEKAKRKGFSSPINVFDDFIIFYSITIYPLVSGIQWYSTYTRFGFFLIIASITTLIRITTLYIKAFINMRRDIEYHYKKSVIYFSIYLLCFISLNSYNHVSQFCEDTFHLDNCRFLRTKISSAYGICGMLNLFTSIYHFYIVKQFTAIHNRFKEIPFIVGYILSNNTYTTKISFSICSIAFSRLIEHFGEDPEKINTVISYYLNYREDLEIDATKVQKNEILDDLIENLKAVKGLHPQLRALKGNESKDPQTNPNIIKKFNKFPAKSFTTPNT
ncbi:37143_t:CDS:2 [Gigaspora margarita]|uniref:37143_t:CDS:1 n=1 Tax=Gigaspora margarita TaxID=4874 RepID=A0ABN7VKL9_GIGMA|nr:37143_t:CDS:2 [Gigaspora margarita]